MGKLTQSITSTRKGRALYYKVKNLVSFVLGGIAFMLVAKTSSSVIALTAGIVVFLLAFFTVAPVIAYVISLLEQIFSAG